MKLTTNMKGFQKWMQAHPRKKLDGYFSIGERELTHDEVKAIVNYAVAHGYKTEAEIPESELQKILGSAN